MRLARLESRVHPDWFAGGSVAAIHQGDTTQRDFKPDNTTNAVSQSAPQRSEGPTDQIPPAPLSNEALVLGGSRVGMVNTPGDTDGYRIELVAGQSYVFTLTGTGTSPLEDPYLELRGPDSSLVAIDDDAGPGRSALLRFTATESGAYYINARAWHPDSGPTLVGEYTLTAALGPAQNPLDALDLGFTVSTTNITVYFSALGEIFDGVTSSRSWTEDEIAAAMLAMSTFSAVTTLTFTQTLSSSSATFIMSLADLPENVVGQFSTAGAKGYGVFDPSPAFWSTEMLQPGGFAFSTIIHEIGHGLGLAHPHDNGGIDPDNSSEIMQGVISEFGSFGTFGLNQGIYTIMSYNRGAASLGDSGSNIFGAESTPGSLDIALLQQKYGVNITTNAGDNVYVLTDTNGPGTRYETIWDTGGTDSIVYTGIASATIDLRAATLLNAPGGGGGLSTTGNYGGFVIASGVVIEIATSGSGNDRLFGGAGDNILTSGAGGDTLSGGSGADLINGGDHDDRVTYEDDPSGVVVNLLLQTATDGWGFTDTLVGIEQVTGSAFDDVLITGVDGTNGITDTFAGAGNDRVESNAFTLGNVMGGAGNDVILSAGSGRAYFLGEGGQDQLIGGAGDDNLLGGDGDDYLEGHDGHDSLIGGSGVDTLIGGTGFDGIDGSDGNDVISGGEGGDSLAGGQGDDVIDAGADDDVISGGAGNDIINGGAGVDTLSYDQDGGSGVRVDLGLAVLQDTGGSGFDTVLGIENLRGTNFSDSLIGSIGANELYGLNGDDVLNGGEGDDILDGGWDNDILLGGAGDDLMGSFRDSTFYYPGEKEVFDGGDGVDTVFFRAINEGLTLNLAIAGEQAAPNSGTVSLLNVENLVGSQHADHFTGTSGVNRLEGYGGDDQLFGGEGDDLLQGGLGSDVVDGGDGFDIAQYTDEESAVAISLAIAGPQSTLTGEDTLVSIEGLAGSSFSDQLTGNAADNRLSGNAGDDVLSGAAGSDVLLGGLGDDALNGGSGIDTASYSGAGSGVTVSLALAGAQDTGGAGVDTLTQIESLVGSAFGDTLSGDGFGNTLDGGAGNDVLSGGAGVDTLIGGLGDDTLIGGDNTDFIVDTAGVVSIDGGSGNEQITLGAAVVSGVVDGGVGTDQLTKGGSIAGLTLTSIEILNTNGGTVTVAAAQFEGFDTIRFSAGQPFTAVSLALSEAGTVDLTDELLGRRALFAGTSGNDTVTTSDGSDQIDGGAGDDVLSGGLGNDTLIGGLGDDVLSGGEGTDFLVELAGVVSVDGGAGDDVITLGAALNAGTVSGGLGTDQLNKGGAIAGLAISGIEIVNTNGGTLLATAAQLEGFDTIRFSAAQATTAVSLALSEAGTVDLVDELLGRRALFAGSSGNDVITTSNGSDQIDGGAGDDVLSGGLGTDTLIGGLGDDQLNGGDGGDFLVDLSGVVAIDGGDGDDTLTVGALVTAGTIAGGLGTDQLNKSGNLSGVTVSGIETINTNGGTLTATAAQLEGFDTIRFSAAQATAAISLVQAGAGTVDLTDELLGRRVLYQGSADNDTVTTSNGADRLDGGAGDDTLNGGLGNDTVIGGLGNDLIVQGATDGRDLIDGGAGVDTYRLQGTAAAETFRIMTRAEALLAGITGLAGSTEIVITRNGTDNASIIAELDNIEEIEIDSLVATANNGNGVVDGGTVGGDTVIVVGDFTTTSLDYSTITINGSAGNDTVDITGLTSAHRVVFASNGGADTVIGSPRPQDVFGLSDGLDVLLGLREMGGRGPDEMRDMALAGPGRGLVPAFTPLAPDDALEMFILQDMLDRPEARSGTLLSRTMIDSETLAPLDLAADAPLQIAQDAISDTHRTHDPRITPSEVDYILG